MGPGSQLGWAEIYGSSPSWDLWVHIPHLESVGPHLRTGMGSMGLHFPTERDGLRSAPCARLQIVTWESPPPSWDLRAPIPKPGSLGLHRPVGLDGDHGALICSQLRAPQAEDGRRKPWFRCGDSSCWEQPAVAQQQQQHSSTAAAAQQHSSAARPLPHCGPFPTPSPSAAAPRGAVCGRPRTRRHTASTAGDGSAALSSAHLRDDGVEAALSPRVIAGVGVQHPAPVDAV